MNKDNSGVTTLYLIRHGLTQANLEHRLLGTTDLPLTEEGRAQLPYLADYFCAVPVDAVYSSPLIRAAETAKCIAQAKGLETVFLPQLKERDCGRYEGFPVQDMIRMTGVEARGGLPRYPGRYDFGDGETPQTVQDRMAQALTGIVHENRGKDVAVVSHGMALQMALAFLMRQSVRDFESRNIRNLSVTKVMVYEDEHAEVLYVGDLSFLPPEMKNLNDDVTKQ